MSSLIGGFNSKGNPSLYLTDAAGTYSEWKANAIGGRNEKAVREFLEKNYSAEIGEQDAIKVTVKALLEVVDSGAKNMEIAVMRKGEAVFFVKDEQLTAVIEEIEKEQEEAKAKASDEEAS